MAAKVIFLVVLALGAVLAMAQEAQQSGKEEQNKIVVSLWRDKETCEDKPTLPVTLENDASKCQPLLKDFFWTKAHCENGKLNATVCTDAECSTCFDLSDIAEQNVCKHEPQINGAYLYTCNASPENILEAKANQTQVPANVNHTIGKELQQKVESSVVALQQNETKPLANQTKQLANQTKQLANQTKQLANLTKQVQQAKQQQQSSQEQQRASQGSAASLAANLALFVGPIATLLAIW